MVEMKGNGKGYLRGTVVDLMETAGKWWGVGAPEALPSVTNGCCGVRCSASGRFLLCRKAMVVKCGASVEGVWRV